MLTPTPPIDKRSGRLFDRKNIKINFCCLECIVLRLHFVAGKNIHEVKTSSVTHQFICICENMSRHCNCLWTMHCKSIGRIARVLTQIRMWLLWHLQLQELWQCALYAVTIHNKIVKSGQSLILNTIQDHCSYIHDFSNVQGDKSRVSDTCS